MPRKRRQKSETDFYHIIVKGINGEKIFNQQREKIYFKSIILNFLSKYPIEIYSYCIMSNHAHFIIRAELKVLSAYMSVVLSEYAIYYNFKHHRNGHVFQNRFLSECIETEKYYWSCLRYIHLNPVKAKMIKNPEKYKYSSMIEYIDEIPQIITQNAFDFMRRHFGTIVEFKEFHRQKMEFVFCDVLPDVKIQQEDMAFEIACSLQDKYNLSMLCQVIEEKEIRKLFEIQLQDKMGVSKKRSKELCLIIKSKIDKFN